MFKRLAEAVEELTIPVDGDALSEVIGLRDRLEAKIAEAIGDFDAASLWDLDGATSMTAWLRGVGLTRREAARAAGCATRLRGLAVTARAWREGELSGGQVEAVLAAVGPRHVDRFAGHEADVVPSLVGLSVADTARAMQVWRAHAEALADDDVVVPEPERSVHLSETLHGTWALDGTLDAEGGSVLAAALRVATSDDVEAEPARSPATRRADALIDVCRHFLDHQQHRAGGRHRPHLNVVVDLEDLQSRAGGRVIDGPALGSTGVEALLCDSALHRVVMTGRSAVLDYGSATRTIPAPLWNALVIRDEHCRFPDCDRPSSWCDGHHVVSVIEGGPTCVDNLVVACRRHHVRLHQPGWEAKLLPDATFVVTDPAGRVHRSHPPRAGPKLDERT